MSMENIDVLIIQPFRKPKFREMIIRNYPYLEPFNTASLVVCSVLEQKGVSIKFLALSNIFYAYDPIKNEKELYNLLGKYSPKVIIFSSDYFIANRNTATLYSVKIVSSLYKRKNENIKIVLTGRNGVVLGKKLFEKLEDLDIVVKGECEEIIFDLINAILNEQKYDNIPHIIYRDEEQIIENEGVGFVKDINSLPVPAYHLIKQNIEYMRQVTKLRLNSVGICIRTSYGCPFNCKFCAGTPNWSKYRTKSNDVLNKEINYLYETLGKSGRIVFIEDELFTYDLKHVENVCALFKEKNIKVYGLFGHTKFFNDYMAKLLKEITQFVFFGAENCCNQILDLINKGQTFEDILQATEIANKYGLNTHLEWIVGLPGENIETICKNLNMVYYLLITNKISEINTYIFCPHPGTEFARNPKKYGLKIIDDFDDILEEGGYPVHSTKDLSRNQIFIYYLLSQLMIKEAISTRDLTYKEYKPLDYNQSLLSELFKKVLQ